MERQREDRKKGRREEKERVVGMRGQTAVRHNYRQILAHACLHAGRQISLNIIQPKSCAERTLPGAQTDLETELTKWLCCSVPSSMTLWEMVELSSCSASMKTLA